MEWLPTKRHQTRYPPSAVIKALDLSGSSFIRHRLAYGAFVSTRHRYLFFETPKCGATTTKAILWQIEELGDLPDHVTLHARPERDRRMSLLTVDRHVAQAALTSDDYFRFTLWRDPVKRLASAYWDKIHLARDTKPEWAGIRAKIVKAFDLASPHEITFDHFAQYACAQPDSKRNPHWASIWRLSLADHIKFNLIVNLDRYVADMGRVLTALGIPEARWPDLYRRHNASGSDMIKIRPTTAELIRNAYADDYRLISLEQAS